MVQKYIIYVREKNNVLIWSFYSVSINNGISTLHVVSYRIKTNIHNITILKKITEKSVYVHPSSTWNVFHFLGRRGADLHRNERGESTTCTPWPNGWMGGGGVVQSSSTCDQYVHTWFGVF